MNKDILERQKINKEAMLKTAYILRDQTLNAEEWMSSNLIKVILGPRRAGKSVFASMMLRTRDFAYFNFDEEILGDVKHLDTYKLMSLLREFYGDTKNVFFDEIQNLPRWELFTNRLQREGYNLVVTGSNANLLNKELATHLTGRHIPLEILPFNLREFLRAKQFETTKEQLFSGKKGELLALVRQYVISGGYPEVVMQNLSMDKYLGVLFEAVMFKDVIRRYKIRSAEQISKLGIYLLNNIGSKYGLRRVANVLNFKSTVTLEKYINYLVETYLFFSLHGYSHKTHERLQSSPKIYVIDNGFIAAKAVSLSPDNGRLLENAVFVELLKAGLVPNHEIFYYNTKNNREVDFVLRKGYVALELIQVVYEMPHLETEDREVRALLEAAEELDVKKLTIITWDEKKTVEKNGLTINFVPFWERFGGIV